MHKQTAFAAVVVGSLAMAASRAGAIDDLIVFGDSLSDTGNISTATLGAFPGPFYFDGRISNGPVYIEAVSAGLGFGPMTHSLAGGDNFAYGGAQATGTGGINGIFVDDLDEQVDDYLATRTVNPEALYVIMIGSNDLVTQIEAGAIDVGPNLASYADSLDQLYQAGARRFLVSNVPDLSQVPRYNDDPALAALAASGTAAFNAGLWSLLDAFESNPGTELIRFDLEAAFDAIIADPAAFGLTNVTDPAAPGLEIGMTTYDPGLIVPNPDEYLFWDELHPTRAGHALLGQAVLATVPEPAGLGALAVGGALLLRRNRALRSGCPRH